MELVNIRELYRNQEEYLDKTVTIGRLGAKYPEL